LENESTLFIDVKNDKIVASQEFKEQILILNKSNELIEVIFACLAGGSFLYIACSEVIVEEFSVVNWKFTKLLFFIIGIVIISSLNFLEVEE